MYDNIDWGDDLGVAGRIRPFKYSFNDFFFPDEKRRFADSWDNRTGGEFDQHARAIAKDRRDRIRELALLFHVSHQHELFADLGKNAVGDAGEVADAIKLLRESGYNVSLTEGSQSTVDMSMVRDEIVFLCSEAAQILDREVTLLTAWYRGDVTDVKLVLKSFRRFEELAQEKIASSDALRGAMTDGEHINAEVTHPTLESLGHRRPTDYLNYLLTEVARNMARRLNYHDAICAQDVILTKDEEIALTGCPVSVIAERLRSGVPVSPEICRALADSNPNFWFQQATEQESVRMSKSKLPPDVLFTLKNVRYQLRKTLYKL